MKKIRLAMIGLLVSLSGCEQAANVEKALEAKRQAEELYGEAKAEAERYKNEAEQAKAELSKANSALKDEQRAIQRIFSED